MCKLIPVVHLFQNYHFKSSDVIPELPCLLQCINIAAMCVRFLISISVKRKLSKHWKLLGWDGLIPFKTVKMHCRFAIGVGSVGYTQCS